MQWKKVKTTNFLNTIETDFSTQAADCIFIQIKDDVLKKQN